ncbi:hypothetical protein AcV7_004180 [Taiwanofungus camphoratus]|nr:hypothetical protein AcV7_004180 [Antrodia cinnamomea]
MEWSPYFLLTLFIACALIQKARDLSSRKLTQITPLGPPLRKYANTLTKSYPMLLLISRICQLLSGEL